MANKFDFQDWELTEGKGPKQHQPSGPLHTFILILWMLASIAFLALGLFMIFNSNLRAEDTYLGITAVLAAVGVIYIFAVATKTTHASIKTLVTAIILLIGAFIFYFFGNGVVTTFRIVAGGFGIFIALGMFANVYRQKIDGVPWFGSLFWGLVYLAMSIAILFSPDGTRLLAILTGIYLVLLAGNVFFEALTAIFFNKPHLKRSFVVTLPMAVAACLPMAFFREVNTIVKEEPDEALFLQDPDSGTEPDLIVYIHTRAGFIPGFGHCDLCYNGKVYSFGDYDEATWKFGGFLAAGTMALIPPEKHIIQALQDDKKMLMAYGIKLTPELKKKVEEKLENIMSLSYEWDPKAELAAKGKIEGDPKSFKDVGSLMYLEEDAQLYKFKEGSPYKTYYALGQNCSEVVNDVVGASGIHLFRLNGIVTPGAYLEYLDELYETDNSIVTERRLYMLDANGRPVEYPLDAKQPIKLGELSM